MVSAVSAANTPHVGDSPAGQRRDSFTVYTFAQVGNTIVAGGKFNNVNGVISRKIARLNLSNGQAVNGFKVPFIDGPVNDFAALGGRLFVGGQFDKVDNVAHSGLATINPATGALDPYLNVQLTGHHNWNGGPTGFSRDGRGRQLQVRQGLIVGEDCQLADQSLQESVRLVGVRLMGT